MFFLSYVDYLFSFLGVIHGIFSKLRWEKKRLMVDVATFNTIQLGIKSYSEYSIFNSQS